MKKFLNKINPIAIICRKVKEYKELKRKAELYGKVKESIELLSQQSLTERFFTSNDAFHIAFYVRKRVTANNVTLK